MTVSGYYTLETKRSADEMGLKTGDHVTAVVKATEVMIAKP